MIYAAKWYLHVYDVCNNTDDLLKPDESILINGCGTQLYNSDHLNCF